MQLCGLGKSRAVPNAWSVGPDTRNVSESCPEAVTVAEQQCEAFLLVPNHSPSLSQVGPSPAPLVNRLGLVHNAENNFKPVLTTRLPFRAQ